MPIFPPAGGGGGSSGNRRLVVFDASSGTPAILKAVGVTSITDNGAGDFTLNFNAMPDADYGMVCGGRALAGSPNAGWVGMENHDNIIRSTTQLRVYTLDSILINPTDWPRNSFLICDQ